MLQVNNITFGFTRKNNLFENVSFSIKKGESLRLEGGNGTGKTTLLNCITQFKNIQSGNILFENNSIVGTPVFKLWNLGIRRIFQDRMVFESMKVKEQLYLTHGKRGWFSFPKESDLIEIIQTIPYLKKILNSPGEHLSGGERMLVALSMILKTNGKILLLDEPFNGLSSIIFHLVQ